VKIKGMHLRRRFICRWGAEGRKRGSILMISLWSLCFLTTFAVLLGYGVRQKLSLVKRLDERDQLRFLAQAGVKKAINEIRKKDKQKAFYALKDPLSHDEKTFKEIPLAGGVCEVSYRDSDAPLKTPGIRYGLIDEESKINFNKASLEVLERFFKNLLDFDEMEAQELAARVVDWRDSDQELSIPLGSAEDNDYEDLSSPYEAKDADLEVLEELLLVKGMTREILDQMQDYITVYGEGEVNINTASRLVLLALGLNEDLADKILDYRRGKDAESGTVDDHVFENPSEILPQLSQAYPLGPSDVAQLSGVAGQSLVTNSQHFTIRSIAHLNQGKQTAQIVSVVDRSGKILYWQEAWGR